MKQTENYRLNKIELEDSPPDITVINPNWDKIDTEMKRLSEIGQSYTQHVEYHVESHVVSQRARTENDPDYGLS